MIRIEQPVHGAILNHRHGTQTAEGLRIQVRGTAPLLDRVTVNDVIADRCGEQFSATVLLTDKESDITAIAEGVQGRSQHEVRVVWDRFSRPRYRFSIDDNSFFLRDIARQQYKSLFDCWYLAMLRDMNVRYGAKFTLNIYFATDDGFELPQFPDRYKSEWRDNAGWLVLAFHAYADKPDRPYEYTSPEKLAADFDLVAEQIQRFAGSEAYAPPTVIHWGMLQPTALRVLAARDVRVLSGMFRRYGHRWDINYCLDDERSEYVFHHDALKDFESGIIFSRGDIVCNTTPIERVAPTLQSLADDPATAEIMDLFTHEQYFWDFYRNYLPDHPQRIEAAIRWVTEHGYEPVFYHEGFLGGPE